MVNKRIWGWPLGRSLFEELKPVNEQKKRINVLKNNEETTSSDGPNQLVKKTRGNFVFNRV